MLKKLLRVTVRNCGGSTLTCLCVGIVMALIVAIVTSYTSSAHYFASLQELNLDIKQLENSEIDKLVIEQDDGSINLVFHIPSNLQANRDLKRAPIRTLQPLPLSNSSVKNMTEDKNDNIKPKVENLGLNKTKVEKLASNYPKIENLAIKGTDKAANKSGNKTDVVSTKPTTKRPKLTTSFPLTIQPNPYQLNNKKVCSVVKDLLFMVVVHSSTLNFQRRNNIRETWANSNLFRNHSMRIVFILGKPQKDSTQALIEHENVLHGDIVQGKFIDSYHNLTHKGVLGLRWVTEHCRHAKIIVKVDDDVFLNIFKLMDNMLTEYSKISRQIMCAVRWNGTSQIQRGSGKWKVDEGEFFNMTHFPVTYCNGFFVVMTSDIIPELYTAAKVTPFFWVDDVYIFGQLPHKAGNITHKGLQHLNLNEKEAIKCFESTEKPCSMLVANAHSDGIMDKLWYGALSQHRQLAERYIKKTLFANS